MDSTKEGTIHEIVIDVHIVGWTPVLNHLLGWVLLLQGLEGSRQALCLQTRVLQHDCPGQLQAKVSQGKSVGTQQVTKESQRHMQPSARSGSFVSRQSEVLEEVCVQGKEIRKNDPTDVLLLETCTSHQHQHRSLDRTTHSYQNRHPKVPGRNLQVEGQVPHLQSPQSKGTQNLVSPSHRETKTQTKRLAVEKLRGQGSLISLCQQQGNAEFSSLGGPYIPP